MGSLENQRDRVVGNTEEKIGEMLNKENLTDKGHTQSETAEGKERWYQARIDEIEDQQVEEEAKRQNLTQERKNSIPDRNETPPSESDHTPGEQKIEEQRTKHYMGIEEKL